MSLPQTLQEIGRYSDFVVFDGMIRFANIKVDPYLRKKGGKVESVEGHLREQSIAETTESILGAAKRSVDRAKAAKARRPPPAPPAPAKVPAKPKKKAAAPKLPKNIQGGWALPDPDEGEFEPRTETAFDWYQATYALNRRLREGKVEDDDIPIIEALDDAMSKPQRKTDKHYRLYRGAELPTEFRGKDPKTLIGATWVEKAFTSATDEQDQAEGYLYPEGLNLEGNVSGPPAMMEIIAAPGVGYLTRPWAEASEQVLQRNLRYTVLKVLDDGYEGGVDEEGESYPGMKYPRLVVLAEVAGDPPAMPERKDKSETEFEKRVREAEE